MKSERKNQSNIDNPKPKIELLKDFKLLEGSEEVFGWYNPISEKVIYLPWPDKPDKPDKGWYDWHSHPKGTNGNPSEVDMLDGLYMDNKDPQYISGEDGLTMFQMIDSDKTKEKFKEIKELTGVRSFHDYVNIRDDEDFIKKYKISHTPDPKAYGYIIVKLSDEEPIKENILVNLAQRWLEKN
jgi:hypothetical protein